MDRRRFDTIKLQAEFRAEELFARFMQSFHARAIGQERAYTDGLEAFASVMAQDEVPAPEFESEAPTPEFGVEANDGEVYSQEG